MKTKKVGRPLKEVVTYIPSTFQLHKETNDHLLELVDRSYMSKTGIGRMAIDYLYYQMTSQPIPEELNEVIKDLKKGLQYE